MGSEDNYYNAFRQIDFLTEEVAKVIEEQSKMIDPVEYGKLEGRVDALGKKLDSVEAKVDRLVELASEGKGGIRALWFAGSVVAGVLGWLGAERIMK